MADKAQRNPEKQRWINFILASYIVLAIFLWMAQRANPPSQTGASGPHTPGQTTGTLNLAGQLTTGSAQLSEPPRTVDANSSVTIQSHPGELVSARTDKYAIDFDSVGAVVHSWRLMDPGSLSYERTEATSRGIEMVRRIPTLEGGFAHQQVWPLEIAFKEANARSYEDFNHVSWENQPVAGGPDTAAVRMISPEIRGIRVEKSFDIPQGKYFSTFRVTLHNDTENAIPIVDEQNRGMKLRWGPGLLERGANELNSGEATYDTAVFRGSDEVRVFRPDADPGAEPIEIEDRIQWAGVESKFFTALIVPPQPDDAAKHEQYVFRTLVPEAHRLVPRQDLSEERRLFVKNYHPPLVMELITDRFDLPARSSKTFEFKLYVGPKKHSILKDYGHNLQSAIFAESWWWMRMIYLGLTDLLNWIYTHIFSNYGIAIMLLTVLVKIAVFPLVHRSIKIQAKSSYEMKRIKPHIDALNEKYKDNPQEKSRQMWKVYQEHGVNPLGAMRSCIPILPQMPIFIGLYRVANDTIDLQDANFLWIKDLSSADRLVHLGAHIPLVGSYFNILPILVALTQMISSKIALSRSIQMITDPTQRQMQQQMVYLIPVIVMVTMYHFPAGLMLYWIASNVWQILQTLITNRILDYEEAQHAKKGPPPPKAKKQVNPNSFMGKMMARAEKAREEYEKQQKELQKRQQSGQKKRK